MRIRQFLPPPLLLLLAAALLPDPLPGQAIPFSQHGTVSQRVSVTDILIEYNRPTARGRQLFPGVVAWERIWSPGADTATRISFSRDVVVEGQPLRAGAYSLWLIPRETAPWTLVFNRAAHVFHQPYPGEGDEALRIPLSPTSGDHLETLAWYFPVVIRDSTVLRFHWGNTIVAIHLKAPAIE